MICFFKHRLQNVWNCASSTRIPYGLGLSKEWQASKSGGLVAIPKPSLEKSFHFPEVTWSHCIKQTFITKTYKNHRKLQPIFQATHPDTAVEPTSSPTPTPPTRLEKGAPQDWRPARQSLDHHYRVQPGETREAMLCQGSYVFFAPNLFESLLL